MKLYFLRFFSLPCPGIGPVQSTLCDLVPLLSSVVVLWYLEM